MTARAADKLKSDGWKVMDISTLIDFKAMPMFNRGVRRR